MEAYTSFARVYDTFMDNVPYEEWASFVIDILKENKILEGSILDLGCGTGSISRLLFRAGYDVLGVDLSEEMLEIALEKQMEEMPKVFAEDFDDSLEESIENSPEAGPGILYLQQDMRELEVYDKVAAVVSCCDCLNYILDPKELLETFFRVKECLKEDGIFFFDFNSSHKYRDVIGETTIAEDREDCSFIWDNYYYEDEGINEYELTLFIKEGEENLYRKYQETHLQRGYCLEGIQAFLEEAGFEVEQIYDDYTKKAANKDSERICIVAKNRA